MPDVEKAAFPKGCITIERMADYRAALIPMLVDLACQDVHIAGGLALLAPSAARNKVSPRAPLAAALLARAEAAHCPGVKGLPEETKQELREAVTTAE